MERFNASSAPTTGERKTPARRVLCAYSPRWLSGPTPGYRGLCPTWSGDDAVADPAAHTS